MKPESKFYQTKLKAFLANCGFLCTRIETGTTTNGFPDLYCRGKNKEFHAELKIGTKVGGRIKISWRPGQIGWGIKHITLGLNWFLFVEVQGKKYYTRIPKKDYSLLELNILKKDFFTKE